eukprot:Sspe_Gene.103942::Locus_79818_Transcript_1_1_Confidence_1.000_Length_1159::g.103942::m.103942
MYRAVRRLAAAKELQYQLQPQQLPHALTVVHHIVVTTEKQHKRKYDEAVEYCMAEARRLVATHDFDEAALCVIVPCCLGTLHCLPSSARRALVEGLAARLGSLTPTPGTVGLALLLISHPAVSGQLAEELRRILELIDTSLATPAVLSSLSPSTAAKIPAAYAFAEKNGVHLPKKRRVLTALSQLVLDNRILCSLTGHELVALVQGFVLAKAVHPAAFNAILLRAVSPDVLPTLLPTHLCELSLWVANSGVVSIHTLRPAFLKIAQRICDVLDDLHPLQAAHLTTAYAAARVRDTTLTCALVEHVTKGPFTMRILGSFLHAFALSGVGSTDLCEKLCKAALENNIADDDLGPYPVVLNSLTK